MTEYTPTAEEIRSLVESFSELLNVSPYEGLGDTILGQFDCWLAEHDRQVAEAERERIIKLLQEAKSELEGHDSAECKCRDYAKAYGWAIRDIKGQEQ